MYQTHDVLLYLSTYNTLIMQSISAIKHTPSVTYKDFVDSLTTRPQYFRFFLDKACGIAANIGIRYDDEKRILPLRLSYIYGEILTSTMRLRQNSVRFSMFVSGTRFENRSDHQIPIKFLD